MRNFILSLIVVGMALSGAAQEPAGTPSSGTTFKATSRLVLLDVVVTDRNGQFVSGLTKDDFTVLEDKQPQKITSFEAPAQHPQNPLSGSQVPVTIFVLDELNTTFQDMAFSRQQLERYLSRQPEHMSGAAALVVINNKEFKVLHDYTRDRDALLEVVKKHSPNLPWKLQKGANFITERLASSLVALQQIAAATMGIPGRKNVVWVGTSFPTMNLIGVHEDVKTSIENAVNRTIDKLLEARISMYPIDPTAMNSAPKRASASGAADGADDDMGNFANLDDDPFDTDVNLVNFGPATGGRSYHWRNDIAQVIQTSVDDGAKYYTIAYVPSNRSDDTKYRTIRIKAGEGLTARARDGYYPVEPPMTKEMVAVDVRQAALNTLPYTGLPVSLTGKAGSDKAAFTLYVDAQSLSWQSQPGGDSRAQVRIAVASLSEDNKILDYDVRELSSTTPAAAFKALLQHPVAFRVQASLSQKVKRIRFVVRDETSGHMGAIDVDPAKIPAVAEPPKAIRGN